MHNPWLHASLRAFVDDLGQLLRDELDGGAELPFEVMEGGGGRGPVLYRYQPCTGAFVDARWSRARALDTYEPVIEGLGPRAGAYLRHRALEGSEPDAALHDLAHRAYEDVTTFRCPEDRFERLFAELDATVEESTMAATVLAPLHGVRISRPRVALGDGLALVRRSAVSAPPGAFNGSGAGDTWEPGEASTHASPLDVFCELVRELPTEADLPVDEARVTFRRTLTALRLSGAGATALSALAWARAGTGAWYPVALGVSPRTRPDSWELAQADETELRELLGILALSRHGRGVGWALDRFEMGCERGLELEALSDYLLALRALLADPGPGDGGVALRLAAVCAPEPDRTPLAARVEEGFRLERELSLGAVGPAGPESPRALVREIEHHLRALLRDVLCGYLDEDLRSAADAILAGYAPPPAEAPHVDEHDTEEFDVVDPAELKVTDTRAEPDPTARPPAAAASTDSGVTPSNDWAPDVADPTDWESYAAPV